MILRYGRCAIAVFAVAVAGAADPTIAKDQSIANGLNQRGVEALSRGDYAAAEGWSRQALAAWHALGPAFEPYYAASLLNLGESICGQGKWRDAAGIYQEALAINRRTLGATHQQTILSLDALANVRMQTGDTEGAAALFQESLAIEREHYSGSILLAHTLLGKAMLAERAGDLDAALPPAEESLAVALGTSGESIDSAMAYLELAKIHRQAGHPERALPLYRKAVAIYRQRLGPEHPHTASLLSQEGLAYIDDHKLGLAEHDLLEAIGLLEHCQGCINELAIAKNNLGLLRFRQKKYEQAARLLNEALSLEPSGLFAVNTMRLLADVREQEHRPGEAAQLRQRASAGQSYH